MKFLWNAFHLWNLRGAMSERDQTDSQKQLNAALSAEDEIAAILRKYDKGAKIYLRKRIFVHELNHCREVDVIAVLQKKVLVIEVKNWRGSVWRNGDRWFHLASSEGQALEFPDITAELMQKRTALMHYLEHDQRIPIKDSSIIVPILVFSNPAVRLDPRTISNMNCVFTIATFKPFAESECKAQSWRNWAASFVLPLGLENKVRIVSALDQIKTWDCVTLHNGTLIHGDLLAIECPSVGVSFERRHLESIQYSWASGNLWGLFTSVWNGSAGWIKLVLCEAKRHKAQKQKKAGHAIRDKEGNVLFAVHPSKKKKDLTDSDRIVFKRAGQRIPEMFATYTIKNVDLSPSGS